MGKEVSFHESRSVHRSTLFTRMRLLLESTYLFPSDKVPNVESDGTTIGVEEKGIDTNTKTRDVFRLDFSSREVFL
jgi:hypothetical protein